MTMPTPEIGKEYVRHDTRVVRVTRVENDCVYYEFLDHTQRRTCANLKGFWKAVDPSATCPNCSCGDVTLTAPHTMECADCKTKYPAQSSRSITSEKRDG